MTHPGLAAAYDVIKSTSTLTFKTVDVMHSDPKYQKCDQTREPQSTLVIRQQHPEKMYLCNSCCKEEKLPVAPPIEEPFGSGGQTHKIKSTNKQGCDSLPFDLSIFYTSSFQGLSVASIDVFQTSERIFFHCSFVQLLPITFFVHPPFGKKSFSS